MRMPRLRLKTRLLPLGLALVLSFAMRTFWKSILGGQSSADNEIALPANNSERIRTQPRGSPEPPNSNNAKQLHLGSKEDVWLELESSLPTLPIGIMSNIYKNPKEQANDSNSDAKCLTMPPPWKIELSNIYWQSLKGTNQDNSYEIFRAYYDDRESVVRILLLSQRAYPDEVGKMSCIFWDENGNHIGTHPITDAVLIQWKWLNYPDEGGSHPYLWSCNASFIPAAVSIMANTQLESDNCSEYPSNALKVDVKVNTDITKDFKDPNSICLCTRPMIFTDPSVIPRLAEWAELVSILGADKIVFYYYFLSDEIHEALEYYINSGKAELHKATLPGAYSGNPILDSMLLDSDDTLRIKTDLLWYNDCLYRNRASFRYMTWLDIDEVILPMLHGDWKDMLKHLFKLAESQITSFSFKNTFYMDEFMGAEDYRSNPKYDQNVPEYHHMLRHLIRSKKHTEVTQPKSIHRTDLLKAVKSHSSVYCLGDPPWCNRTYVQPQLAYLAHYRNGCMEALKDECHLYKNSVVEDLNMLTYKNQLVKATAKALEDMGFLK